MNNNLRELSISAAAEVLMITSDDEGITGGFLESLLLAKFDLQGEADPIVYFVKTLYRDHCALFDVRIEIDSEDSALAQSIGDYFVELSRQLAAIQNNIAITRIEVNLRQFFRWSIHEKSDVK